LLPVSRHDAVLVEQVIDGELDPRLGELDKLFSV